MLLSPRIVGSYTLAALLLFTLVPCASAHPLFRVHVRPSAYRVAPPRLPSVRVPSAIREAAGLVPQAVALAPTTSLARAAITQAPARALMGRH